MAVVGLFFHNWIIRPKVSLIRSKNKNKTLQGCPTNQKIRRIWGSHPDFRAEIFLPLPDPNPSDLRLEIPKEMHKKEAKIPSGPKLWDQFCGS